ncbi:beta-lactamase class C and other penicillin binding proteins [Longilinea arvoryzae]|uniref:Beta-lactamase class C and other penicillin binding proteins n=1 Tax=Longilinea arvoryzae TaxID=360412 RepID=A0A0S7B6I6_9CHLR|nr:serine hydrolase [Longilinea arvoryzae]GAP12767.1 beta-lactamase class C and other penicillin binding proteins [Longilinea arvoryzae]
MNQEKIRELEKTINSDYGNIAGMIVQKNGIKVYENYFNGYTADNPTHVYSVTKSVISALMGIAMEKGYIESTEQRVLEFFPGYTVKRGEKTIQNIRIRDLLTMTVPYKFKSEPYTKYFTSESWVKAALDLLGGKGQVGEFRYTPVVGPDILSGILANVTGQPVLAFAMENLFSPLGIHVPNNVVFHSKEEQIAVMKDKNTRGWVADPQGINTAGWGLFLTPADMAKIGQLYLNNGIWESKQILSTGWIDESTKEHSRWGKLSYGYLWWIIEDDEPIYAALGQGGNVIYVNTKKNMVVSIASLVGLRAKDRIEFIKEYIEPLFENCVSA